MQANETDVREELIVPFLMELGYQRGSSNNISREFSIKYSKMQLGREKVNDPVLRGIPDYVLSVTGSGRWVLEVKRPNCSLDGQVVGQALSYAKHPEVSACYAVITNGIRLKVFAAHQVVDDDPILECAITDPQQLAMSTTGYLSPSAIRRKCKLPPVAAGDPIAEGFANYVNVRGGSALYQKSSFAVSETLPPEIAKEIATELDRRTSFLNGHRANILSGTVKRDDNSRIVAKLEFGTDRDELKKFALQKGFLDVDYVCLDNFISTDSDSPSTFDIVGGFDIEMGEVVYDVVQRQTMEMGFPQTTRYSGSASGFLSGDAFSGQFSISYEIIMTAPFGVIEYWIHSEGSFSVVFE